MNMAREFGKRSYNPDNVTFTNNCNAFGKNGQPWTILNHLLYQNIFLQAYNYPSTAEELALELGIALPYMENELNYLCEQTFLIRDGDRYETSFPIMSKETQREIHELNAVSAKELTALLEKYIDTFNASCIRRGLSWYGDKVDYETAKWVLLIREFDYLVWSANKSPRIPHTKRPDSGEWDITGYEMPDFAQPLFIGQHGMGDYKYEFSQYKFHWNNLQNNHPAQLNEDEVKCFNAVCDGNTDGCDADVLAALEKYGYIRKNADT